MAIFSKDRIELLKKELVYVCIVTLSLVIITLAAVIVTLYRKGETVSEKNILLLEQAYKKVLEDEAYHKRILEQLVKKQGNGNSDTVIIYNAQSDR